jgi:hypothetical protein
MIDHKEHSNQPSWIFRIIRENMFKPDGFGKVLITNKVLDARQRGATTEAYV